MQSRRYTEAILLLYFIGFFLTVKATNVTNVEQQLAESLVKNYKKGGRPVHSNKEAVVIYYDLKINKLEQLVTLNQVLIMHTFVMMKWTDPYLIWKESDYNDTNIITLDQSSIWTPDIMLYNTADDSNESPSDIYKAPVNVYSDGSVVWYVPVVWKSSCMVDIKWFPVDQQVCELVFGSQAYTKSRLELKFHKKPDNFKQTHGNHHVTNGEWLLLGFDAKASHAHYDYSPEPVSQITYTLKIKRRPLFFVLYMIIPVCAVVFLSLLNFIIPPNTGERIGFGVTILLTMGVYLMVISEDLPKTAHTAPLLGVLYITLFYVMALAYVVSTVNVSLLEKVTEPPKFLLKLAKSKADVRVGFQRRRSTRDTVNDGEIKKNWEPVESEPKNEREACNNSHPDKRDSEVILWRHGANEQDLEKEQKNNENWQKIVGLLDRVFFWVFLFMMIATAAVVLIITTFSS